MWKQENCAGQASFIIVKQKIRSILRALLINRILEYLDSALETGNVLYRYLIRIDWMEMRNLWSKKTLKEPVQ
jgi:hypothetical protein